MNVVRQTARSVHFRVLAAASTPRTLSKCCLGSQPQPDEHAHGRDQPRPVRVGMGDRIGSEQTRPVSRFIFTLPIEEQR